MKNFIKNVKQRPPHERRQVAMRISMGITGVLFVGWLATLGVRLATPAPKTAQQATFESQVASVFSAMSFGSKDATPNTLQVASTSDNF